MLCYGYTEWCPTQICRAPGDTQMTVKIGTLTVQLTQHEAAPLSDSTGGGSRTGSSSGKPSRSSQAAKRRSGSKQTLEIMSTAPPTMTIQTSANTVDVRGQVGTTAAAAVDAAIGAARPGQALFVIHGVGTGRVRAEVQAMLKRNPQVERFELEDGSNGGCSIVIVK